MTAPKQHLGLNQQALVDALKSGRFMQGYYRLRTDKCFCVLGVAAHITGADWEKYPIGDTWVLKDSDGNSRISSLPESYCNLYALKHFGQPLSSRNDSEMTFTQLAAEIEAAPEKFFTESR